MPPTVPPSSNVQHAVINALGCYVSTPTAQSILNVARQRTGVQSTQITREQLQGMLDSIERSLLLFLGDAGQAKSCRRALEVLAGSPSGPQGAGPLALRIRGEEDIAYARGEARQLAAQLGFSVVGQTRVMTAVSELARNIVQYAREGRIELVPVADPAGLEVVATDRGPGIADLDRILAGHFRSKLGMGLGLRGVRNLSVRFDVRTEVGRGTTVTALLRVA
jgi:serine/threonine-protein kinase RsbT